MIVCCPTLQRLHRFAIATLCLFLLVFFLAPSGVAQGSSSGEHLQSTILTAHPSSLGSLGAPIAIDGFPWRHPVRLDARAAYVEPWRCSDLNRPDSSAPLGITYEFSINDRGELEVFGDEDLHTEVLRRNDDGSKICVPLATEKSAYVLQPGSYLMVVGPRQGDLRAAQSTGHVQFEMRADFHPYGHWYERPVAQGVDLRTKRQAGWFAQAHTGSVLVVEAGAPGVEVMPIMSSTCTTVSALASSAGAVAAINGGFFGGDCVSTSLVQLGGNALAANFKRRAAIGFDDNGQAFFGHVGANQRWSMARHALGAGPQLLREGQVNVSWDAEGFSEDFAMTPHPRSAVGITGAGKLVLATADGRSEAGDGMTLPEMADWMRWMGVTDAINLDGGGSSTLYVEEENHEGVVNFPVGGRANTHQGQRPVASILAVFAPPLQRPPRVVVASDSLTGDDNTSFRAAERRSVAVLAFGFGSDHAVELRLDEVRGTGNVSLQQEDAQSFFLHVTPSLGDANRGEISVVLRAIGANGNATVKEVFLAVAP